MYRGCTTKKVISSMKTKYPDPEDVDGYEDLDPCKAFSNLLIRHSL